MTQKAVKQRGVTFGGRLQQVVIYEPGVVWYWPAFSRITCYDTARQSVEIEPIALVTKDGDTVGAGAVVVFQIKDLEKYAVECYDSEVMIAEICQAAVRHAIINMDAREIREDCEAVDAAIGARVRKLVNPLGVNVYYSRLTTFAPAQVIFCVGAGSVIPTPPED